MLIAHFRCFRGGWFEKILLMGSQSSPMVGLYFRVCLYLSAFNGNSRFRRNGEMPRCSRLAVYACWLEQGAQGFRFQGFGCFWGLALRLYGLEGFRTLSGFRKGLQVKMIVLQGLECRIM